MTRQYYGVENLGLTAPQRQTLVTALQALGDNSNPNPSRRNHWRIRTDNDAVIFEGLFDDAHWTVQAITNRLATIFGVDPSTIIATTTSTQYGPVVTFARPAGTNRLRLVAFGGLLAAYNDSHAAAIAYLIANSAAWGETTGS